MRAHLGQKLAGALVGGAGGIGRVIGAHRVLDDGHAIGVGGQKLRASFHVGQEDLGGVQLGGLIADGPVSKVGSKLKLNADKSGVLTGAPF